MCDTVWDSPAVCSDNLVCVVVFIYLFYLEQELIVPSASSPLHFLLENMFLSASFQSCFLLPNFISVDLPLRSLSFVHSFTKMMTVVNHLAYQKNAMKIDVLAIEHN